MIGTTNNTSGTEDDDVIIGCSYLDARCSQGSFLFGLGGDDTLQGSSADDWIFGDEGNDDITGADGNDKLFGGSGKDVLQGGFGSDFLYGGSASDELYSGPGDDVLIGGEGTDYFDCGDGYDTIIDFDPQSGDAMAENCEITLTHSPDDIEFLCGSGNSSNGGLQSSTIITTTPLTGLTISEKNNTITRGGVSNMNSDVICNGLEQDGSVIPFSLSYSSSVISNRKSIPTTDYEALTKK